MNLFRTDIFLAVLMILSITGCTRGGEVIDGSERYLEMGDMLRNEGDYYGALDSYLLAAEQEPEKADIFYRIGLVYGILHNQEGADRSLIGGKPNRISKRIYSEESNYSRAVYYFSRASDMGHEASREILRTMYDNIQHRDVKY